MWPGPYQFTHTAAHMAWYAAVNALFGRFKRFAVDYRVVPWVSFTDPEVARVGCPKPMRASEGIAVEVTRYGLDDLDRAITDGAAHGFVKVLTAARQRTRFSASPSWATTRGSCWPSSCWP